MNPDILVIGAGVFGTTAALTLNERGHKVALMDPGPLPNPLAASTDISKVVRMEYGSDETYMIMVEEALGGWRAWNEQFSEPLYHETGVLMVTRERMTPGGFEYESYSMLLNRGHRPERLNGDEITRRFPAWETGLYVDGFFHSRGGYAESGRVMIELFRIARESGVEMIEGETAVKLLEKKGTVTGVETDSGKKYQAGTVVVAAGTWTHELVPELKPVMRSVGQPVFHLKVGDLSGFAPPNFVVFTADVANTGWYGFPVNPREGVIKVANHGAGTILHPDEERKVSNSAEQKLRQFLAETFPSLLEAKIVNSRLCLYCDTLDEHLWIDHHPEKSGLVVAAGGSGHGFKFGPILGKLTADVVEYKHNSYKGKFRWRELGTETMGEEAARYHGE
ncbi:MAG: FAD-dependent oxidoreductase [Candidatus Promineifilaceae bacterium]